MSFTLRTSRLTLVGGVALAVALTPAAGLAAPAFDATVKPTAAAPPPLVYRERTLSNGLRVFSSVDRSTPNVTVQVWYGVGSKNDPQGRSGFAHLFEHMMFKATRDLAAESFDRLTEDVGGQNNASTWDDFTNYYEVIPANHLERILWAEAERMSSLKVDQPNFVSERSVVKEELRQSYLANPYGRLALAVQDASYTIHPYRRSGIGSLGDLDAATLPDVQAFHDTFYRPDDANLIVIGNFDPATLDRWVDRYFGMIARPAAAMPRVTAVEPPRTVARTVTTYAPVVPLPAVVLTWPIPAASSPDLAALRVAEALLATGKSSRLYRDLVYARQLSSDVDATAGRNQQAGLFIVQSVMAGAHTPAEGEIALRDEVGRLRDAPVGADELARAKNQLVSTALQARQSLIGRGFALGYAQAIEGEPARVNTDLAALQAVTAQDVQRVARRYLRDEVRVAVRYLPESARPPGAPAEPDLAQFSPRVEADVLPVGVTAPPAPATLAHVPPPIGAPVSPSAPAFAERTLANGLRVIVARTSALPLVTTVLAVKSGAASDPAGRAGLQRFVVSLLGQGAGGRSAVEFAAAIENLGGDLQANAGYDSAHLALTVPSDELASALPLLSDAARRPAFAPEEVERLRAQTRDQLTEAMQQPGALARMVVAPVIFGQTPYGRVTTPATLARIDAAAIRAQYLRTFRPDNAVLIFTGDVEAASAFALAQATFGDWRRPQTPPPVPVDGAIGAARTRPRVVVVDLPGAGQAAVAVVAPSIARDDPRYLVATVINGVLGGGYSARLNEEVRIKRGLSYGAGSRIEGRRGAGLFIASAQTRNEKAAEVAEVMQGLTRELAAAPIPAEEFAARKAALIGARGLEIQEGEGLAGVLLDAAIYGRPLRDVATYTTDVEGVDVMAARAAAPAAFDPTRESIVIVGDGKTIIAPLKTRFPDAEIVTASDLDLARPSLTAGR